jgi:hypothetical protein
MPENAENNINSENNSKKSFSFWLALSAVLIAMVFLLRAQGRVWWCKLGDYAPFTFGAWSAHTSQHFFDPYTFTHVLHGVLFFWLVNLLFSRLNVYAQFSVAIFAETAWEVLENSNAVIEHYRQNTASLDYFGDSVFNSIGDVFACAAGFFIARRLGFRRSLAFFLLTEIILLVWIRDSLLLNIIMLIYPLDSVKAWQIG